MVVDCGWDSRPHPWGQNPHPFHRREQAKQGGGKVPSWVNRGDRFRRALGWHGNSITSLTNNSRKTRHWRWTEMEKTQTTQIRTIQGGANKSKRTVVFGELIAGYCTPSCGTAYEVFPKPGECAVLSRMGSPTNFSLWIVGTISEIMKLPEFLVLPDEEKQRVWKSLNASEIEAGLEWLRREVECWKGQMEPGDDKSMRAHLENALSRSQRRLSLALEAKKVLG